MIQPLKLHEAALVAAHVATEAAAELLRFVREGASSDQFAFGEEVAGRLAEALFYAIDIEDSGDAADLLTDGEKATIANLRAALQPFIEGRAS
ncbi:MAG TPA: hypothetical protein VF503_20755 [Sphingobium sp.]|uniref:hypothetical protein n=1 Tax=Sphingobium sp. TaxID=1912891 RepID=UPI002ED1761D